MTALSEVCLVGTRTGNWFMNELLEAIAYEIEAAGVRARLAFDEFPSLDSGGVYVVIPHEFFETVPLASHPTLAQFARTITLDVEQPGTRWFELSYLRDRRAAAVLAIQAMTVRELRRRGVRAELFAVGYTEFWDRWRGDEGQERATDVLYMGSANERRDRILAGYARTLWPLETRLLIPPEEPKTKRRPDFLIGDEKWEALRTAKVLLNVHRQELPFFEWLRALEALSNGCVVVSEHSSETAPLVAGEHFISGRAEHLAELAVTLARDDAMLARIRTSAYDCVRRERPMGAAVEQLLAVAERVVARANRFGFRARSETLSARVRTGASLRLENTALAVTRRLRQPLKSAVLEDSELLAMLEAQGHARFQIGRIAPAMKRVVLENLALRRALETQAVVERGRDPDAVVEVARTPAYDRARVRVSIVIPLYNHAREVGSALRTAAESDFDDVEIVVLDDASKDDSRDAVLAFFEERPYVPALLLRHELNRGLGRSRDDLLRSARGEFAFLLDADNELYPTAIGRLVTALDSDPQAVFAYSMSERHDGGKSIGLLTHLPWEPDRLRRDNYIDAMSLVRTAQILELGGFTEDLRLYGWEDYDLWCRCAENGRHGILVPQILCRYRQAPGSMISVTDIDDREMRAVIRMRYPGLMNTEPADVSERAEEPVSAREPRLR